MTYVLEQFTSMKHLIDFANANSSIWQLHSFVKSGTIIEAIFVHEKEQETAAR